MPTYQEQWMASYRKNWDVGYRNGRMDALLGIQSTVARFGNPQVPGYCEGYRAGQADVRIISARGKSQINGEAA